MNAASRNARREPSILPSDEQLRKSCPAMWSWYDSFFPDPKHPIRSRLVLALIRRQCHLQTPPGFPPGPTTLPKLLEADSPQLIPYWQQDQNQKKFFQVYNEARDILSWLHPEPIEPAWEVLRLHTVQAIWQQGISLENILAIVPKLSHVPRGAKAKASMRIAAVKALELRMESPDNSWAIVTRKACPCGEASHDYACVQRIRQFVMRLQEKLQVYGV